MTKQKAIRFLKKYQPLPCDDSITEKLINQYDTIREFFLQYPDKECIPYFLNSFGGENGLGVYQLIEDVLLKYSKKEVLPHLLISLERKEEGILYWNTQIASSFPDKKLIRPLVKLLKHSDRGIRFFAVIALGGIESVEVLRYCRNIL